MIIITSYLALVGSVDEDGDTELILRPDALSTRGGQEYHYLTADEAKTLVDALNKLFDFGEKDKC